MVTNTTALASAYKQFRAELTKAAQFHDADFTHNAITRKRYQGVMQARANLLSALPDQPTAPAGTSRADYLASRAPRTADTLAVAQHEFGIVTKLLEAGRPIEQIIRDASPTRLDAILANAEVLPKVLGSDDPAAVVTDLHGQVFDRLVETGESEAVSVAASERDFVTSSAWHRVLSEAIEGMPTIGALSDLHNSDPEGYQAVLSADPDRVVSAEVDATVTKLDRIAATGGLTAGV